MVKRISFSAVDLEAKPVYQYLLLIIITSIAVVLRFYKLGEWSFWIDEIYTLNRAKDIFSGANWQSVTHLATSVSLSLFGTSEWSARLPPMLIGVVTIPVLYFLIRRIYGPIVALLAVLLLALSPWHIYWSQNARLYTPLLLLYASGLLFFFLGVEEDRPVYILLAVLLLTPAVLERLTALFFVPVVLGYVVLLKILPIETPPGLRFRNIVFLALPLVVLGLVEVPKLMRAETINAAGVQLPSTTSMVEGFLAVAVGNPNHHPLRLLISIIYQIGLPLTCLALFAGIYLLVARRSRQDLFLLSGILVPLVMLLIFSMFTFTVDRYIFVTLPNWVILGAIAVQQTITRAKSHGVILAVGVLVLLLADPVAQDLLYYQYQNGNRPDWKSAFALVEAHKKNEDVVFATRPELGVYYLGEKVMWANDFSANTHIEHSKQVWFVINSGSGFDPKLQKWLQRNSNLVGVFDGNVPGKETMMRVYLYNRARLLYPKEGLARPARNLD